MGRRYICAGGVSTSKKSVYNCSSVVMLLRGTNPTAEVASTAEGTT